MASWTDWLWLAGALAPIGSRTFMWWWHINLMSQILPAEARLIEQHRSVIIPLAGFSFSALLAVAVVDAELKTGLRVPTILLLISFTAFIAALNMQSYKFTRGADMRATALYEAATLSLFLTIANIIFSNTAGSSFRYTGFAAILVWSIDHGIRYKILWKHLTSIARVNADDKRKEPIKPQKDSDRVEEIDYNYCSACGTGYPVGESCPNCSSP